MTENEEMVNEVAGLIQQIQQYNLKALPREKELGSLNFSDAIEPAKRLIGLYNKLSTEILDDLPDNDLNTFKTRVAADLKFFRDIEEFTLTQPNPQTVRDSLITQLKNAYNAAFKTLNPLLAYSACKTTDFKELENKARELISGIDTDTAQLLENMTTQQESAQGILEEIRKVAAEQGVSQQALYFADAAKAHNESAYNWCKATICLAVGLSVYAIASLFIHKIPMLAPTTVYDNIQLSLSKVLIFAVTSYMLYLSARNFLSHRHNAIVNQHRENALKTYNAIVDAAGDSNKKEAILIFAASCMFSPQQTGYSKESGSNAPHSKSVVELLTKPFTETE